jgi:hypothetical protein
MPAFSALLAISPVCDAAPPWQVLIGPFAAEHIEAELDHGAPLLLVPNNLEQAEELARLFQGRSGGGLHLSRELLGPEDREMCWYRYNDPRFDGVSSPDQLRPLAPNLRLRDLELRSLVRLDSLVHGWANHDPELAAVVAAGGGRVWLQCKQPAPIVAGLSRVVEVIGEICWTPLGSAEDPAPGESVLATVSAWLESSCFQPPERRPVNAQSAALSLIWRQDPLRLATARAQHLEEELARLREELEGQQQAFAAERQSWQEGVEAERSSLAVAQAEERSRLAGDAEALRQELQTQQQELARLREELEGQQQAFAAERQASAAEQEALQQSGDALLQGWQAEREAAAEAQALAQARESEIAGLQAQLADQAQVLVHKQGEAERWHAEAKRQRQRLQEAAEEIDAILLALEPSPDLTAP